MWRVSSRRLFEFYGTVFVCGHETQRSPFPGTIHSPIALTLFVQHFLGSTRQRGNPGTYGSLTGTHDVSSCHPMDPLFYVLLFGMTRTAGALFGGVVARLPGSGNQWALERPFRPNQPIVGSWNEKLFWKQDGWLMTRRRAHSSHLALAGLCSQAGHD